MDEGIELPQARPGNYRPFVSGGGLTGSFVNHMFRLTLLAPDIQKAILERRQSKGMQLEQLTRACRCGRRSGSLLRIRTAQTPI